MTDVQLVPAAAGFLFLIFLVRSLGPERPAQHAWVLPAAASALFSLFSARAIAAEGPLGFWVEHTRNQWGNQIWLDLLLAASVAWTFLAPQARAVGMRLWLWAPLVPLTGSMGLLAITARLLYLRARASAPSASTSRPASTSRGASICARSVTTGSPRPRTTS